MFWIYDGVINFSFQQSPLYPYYLFIAFAVSPVYRNRLEVIDIAVRMVESCDRCAILASSLLHSKFNKLCYRVLLLQNLRVCGRSWLSKELHR